MNIGFRCQVSGFRKNRIDRYRKLAIATPLSGPIVLPQKYGRTCRHLPTRPDA